MSVSRSSNFLYFLYFFCKSKIHCGLWKAAKSAHKVSKFQQQLIFGTVEYLCAAVVWAHQEKPLIYFAATELSVHNCVCFFPFFFFFVPQPLSNAYHELAQVYTTNNPAELRSLVNKHSETFTRDNNTGLVKQCLSSLYKKNIQRLTKVSCVCVFSMWCVILTHSRCLQEISFTG